MQVTSCTTGSKKLPHLFAERGLRQPAGRSWSSRLRAAALLAPLLLLGCEKPVPPETALAKLAQVGRPNLVLILVDTLRPDWTAAYGFDPRISPELQRWAQRGVVFERVLAQSSWTKVSMASLLTSLWPRSHGLRTATDGLSEGAITLQETLREAGYRTYAVQSNGWLEQSFGFHQGFDHYVFPRALKLAQKLGPSTVWPHGERVYEEANRLIEAHDASHPFFLYLHFMDVHEYAAPPEFKSFGGGERGAYRAAIRWVDDVMERLRRRLEEVGLSERTVWIFASDHGEAFGENQARGHAHNVFTPVLHVPLVIRFPFAVEALRIRTQVRNLDIAPSLLDLAGVTIPASFEGESLLPLIDSPEPEPDRLSFAGLGPPIMSNAVEQVSVTDGAWTLARNLDDGAREFLFDRRVDPGEDANLIDLEPAEAARMRALLDAHLAVEALPNTRATDVRIDPTIAERLRQLGYLQ
jgi:arylsulfatase A-like enzyme